MKNYCGCIPDAYDPLQDVLSQELDEGRERRKAQDWAEEARQHEEAAAAAAKAAADSEKNAKASETAAGERAAAAAGSAADADGSARASAQSEAEARTNAADAAEHEQAAEEWSALAKSYAVGEGAPEKHPDEKTDNAKYYAGQAKADGTAASASASAAKGSETAAAASRDAAAKSAADAATSEQNAAASKTAAAGSAGDAASSKDAAAKSAAEAAVSASAAKTSETNASGSAAAAKASETAAAASQTAATASEKNAAASETAAGSSKDAAAKSAADAAASEQNADASKTAAANSAGAAKASQDAAKASETAAKASQTAAAGSASDAARQANTAKSYAVGQGLGSERPNEATENAEYYYEQAKRISEGLQGALLPMGSITAAELGTVIKIAGYMYNVTDAFTTDATFKEGAGHDYAAGTNVYWTADDYWDALPGIQVTGVKGHAESVYRLGQVDITPANIGLGNVDNTHDSAKNVASAGKVNHDLTFTGAVTGTWNGSEAKTVNIPPAPGAATDSAAGLMSAADKKKLDGITAGAQPNAVTSVAGKTGAVTVTKADVGLGNVPNVATNDQTPTFTQATTRANLVSGEKLSVLFGKLMKWFADLKAVAWSGSYGDLTGTPSALKSPAALTFTGAESGSYDGSTAKSVAIPAASDALPKAASGNGAAGTGTTWARADHVHPVQTSVSGNAGTATKLAAARSLKADLASTATATFDGSAAQEKIPITGILGTAHGGTGTSTGKAPTAGTADKVGHSLTFSGAATGSWDGAENKTVNIPTITDYVNEAIKQIGSCISGTSTAYGSNPIYFYFYPNIGTGMLAVHRDYYPNSSNPPTYPNYPTIGESNLYLALQKYSNMVACNAGETSSPNDEWGTTVPVDIDFRFDAGGYGLYIPQGRGSTTIPANFYYRLNCVVMLTPK